MKLTTEKLKMMIIKEMKSMYEMDHMNEEGYMNEEDYMNEMDHMNEESFGSPEEEELMRLRQLCDQGDTEACRQEVMMMRHMYGQGDRMHEGKKKRKKNG